MLVRVLKDPFAHIIIENTFEESMFDALWQEILFLQYRMTPETSQARRNFGPETKRGNGIFLNELFTNPKHSVIFLLTRNILNDEIRQAANKSDHYFKLFRKINTDSVLLQCYKNGDYYDPHFDECIFTSVTLIQKEPKKYFGGNFYFPYYNYEPDLKNNSTIIFPSTILHGVKEVNINSNNPENYRYTISMFLEFFNKENQ